MKTYRSEGLVYGKLWGGGEGAYPARKLERMNRDTLLAKAKEMLEDGSLDSGMGYEYLIGALLVIEEIETITVNELDYQRSEYEYIFLGHLTEDQRQFLEDHLE